MESPDVVIGRLCRLHGYNCEMAEGFYQVSAPTGFLVGNTIFHKVYANPDEPREVNLMLADLVFPPAKCDDPACQTCGRIAEPEVEFEDDLPDGRSVNCDLAW